jgi:hypothetical protein
VRGDGGKSCQRHGFDITSFRAKNMSISVLCVG